MTPISAAAFTFTLVLCKMQLPPATTQNMDAIKNTSASATQSKGQKLFRLRGTGQDYEWGKPGSTSLAADLAQEGVGPDFKLDKNHPYAEVR